MIDYFALALTHGLLALAAWRILQRDDLDHEEPAEGQEQPPAAPPPPSAAARRSLQVRPRA
ncbi:hypothetical protein [Novosphingobium sp.]|uniref:hypothetical protein n=1 Tax=Novosphingobium sp. TaxID=1874826 RepID=UPI0035B15722